MTHKLCRPPKNAVNVERYISSLKIWLPDDGKPGLAFVYQGGHKGYTDGVPYGGATACACPGFKCVKSVAMDRACTRWGAANGMDLEPVAVKLKRKG